MPRPRLDVRHLAMIEAVSRLGSVSNAARELGLTQPALSRQLQEAERRLNVELFNREGKGMRLTVAGETLLQCARRVLGDLAESERSAVQIPEDPIVPVRVSLGQYDDYRWFPEFFAMVEQAEPLINLSIVNTGEIDLQQALDDHQIDLAVIPGPVDKRHFVAIPLFEDDLVAICRPGHGFSQLPYVEADHFSQQVYATFGATYHRGFESDRVLLPAGVWPHRVITVGSCRAILELAESGLAITVLSAWIAEKQRTMGRLTTSQITRSGLPISWSAVFRRSDDHLSPASRLAKVLRRFCDGSPGAFAASECAGAAGPDVHNG